MNTWMNWIEINVEEVHINTNGQDLYIFGNLSIQYENSDNYIVASADIELYNHEKDITEFLYIASETTDKYEKSIIDFLDNYIHNERNHIVYEKIMEQYNR